MGEIMDYREFEKKIHDFDESDIAIYCLDEDRTITYWNRAAEILTGYSRKEMIGKYCFQGGLDHIDDEGRHLCSQMCPMMGTIFDGKKRTAKVWLLNKAEERVNVIVETDCLYLDDKTIGAIEYFRIAD